MVKSINVDNNVIESIATDPFQHCKRITHLSLSNNSISTLNKGNCNYTIF